MIIIGKYKYCKAIKLTSENMKKLESILLDFCIRIEYFCSTLRGNNIQFKTLGELLAYDNFGKQRIVTLEISGYGNDYTKVFTIIFETSFSLAFNYGNYNIKTCLLYTFPRQHLNLTL